MALSLVQEPPAESFSPSLATTFLPAQDGFVAKPMHARRAQLKDAHSIHQLIESFSHDGTLLRRSYAEICENIDTFTVVETSSHQFIGCAALHVYGPHLAEVRSIVVRPDTKGRGAGGLLINALLEQAEASRIKCVCLFTRIPTFFEHFHFRLAEHRALKDKVVKDCLRCARRHACDEIAMVIGELPNLVQIRSNPKVAYQG
jgi:amino-acid N-acetyltransferase